MENIAIFASGSGSNAENIVLHFKESKNICIKLILSNNPSAGVLQRAENLNINSFLFTKNDFYFSDVVLKKLAEEKITFIVLAGFLWLVPNPIIAAFPNRIINIHPALLPNFGGKGMFGDRVHEAVIKAGEKESGITIHYVNGEYDAGQIIFQAKCSIDSSDTPDSLASKIHSLEYKHFPVVIENVVSQNTEH